MAVTDLTIPNAIATKRPAIVIHPVKLFYVALVKSGTNALV